MARLMPCRQLMAEQHLFANRPSDRDLAQLLCSVLAILASLGDVQTQPTEKHEVDKVVLSALLIQDLLSRQVDYTGFGQQRLERIYAALHEQRMLLVQDDVADVDRRRVSVTELLLKFEESRLDLILDVFVQFAFVAHQFRL